MLDYVGQVGKTGYPGNYPHINDCVPDDCTAGNESVIRASYCYAVRGCIYLGDVFNLDYILKPYSSACRDINDTYSTNLGRLDYEVDELINLKPVGRMKPSQMRAVLKCLIVRDQFWYQSEKYRKDIQKRSSFDFTRNGEIYLR